MVLIAYGLLPIYPILLQETGFLLHSAREGCAVVGYPEYEQCPPSPKD